MLSSKSISSLLFLSLEMSLPYTQLLEPVIWASFLTQSPLTPPYRLVYPDKYLETF